jgi:DNA repair protein RecO (recombination protein O)
VRTIASEALLLRSVAYGDSDAILTVLTKSDGKLTALARGARKSKRRFAGSLEPVHTLLLRVDDKGKEMCLLREARIAKARDRVVHDLEALEAAGHALRWARQLCPPRTPEEAAWSTLVELLDALDVEPRTAQPKVLLAGAALRLLADVGWALELSRCVACGRPRPEGRAAYVDASRGGIVCRSCAIRAGVDCGESGELAPASAGGKRRLMSNDLLLIANAAQRGDRVTMTVAQANDLIALVEDAIRAHVD